MIFSTYSPTPNEYDFQNNEQIPETEKFTMQDSKQFIESDELEIDELEPDKHEVK